MNIELQLFGKFREFQKSGSVFISIDSPMNIFDFKAAVKKYFDFHAKHLNLAAAVDDSAIADENSVLPLDAMIDSGKVLIILPPVCGG